MDTVYCSGPLFSPEERASMSAIARVLEAAGHATFLPQRDGLESILLRFAGTPLARFSSTARTLVDQAIFALDVFHLADRCGQLVFNMNGRVPDEGAVAEAAIAFTIGKPVVLYKDDARSVFDGSDNSMVLGLSPLAPVASLAELPRALRRAAARVQGPGTLSEPLRLAVRRGARIARWLERVPSRDIGSADDNEIALELRAVLGSD
jgi:nucleoside 2-deoxyribosyltransferase